MNLDNFPLPDDVLFQDSPDAGYPECICSRCGKQIKENELPLRVFVDEGKDGEYRYCSQCSGFPIQSDDYDDFDFSEDY